MNRAEAPPAPRGTYPEQVTQWKETTPMAPNNATIQKTIAEHHDRL